MGKYVLMLSLFSLAVFEVNAMGAGLVVGVATISRSLAQNFPVPEPIRRENISAEEMVQYLSRGWTVAFHGTVRFDGSDRAESYVLLTPRIRWSKCFGVLNNTGKWFWQSSFNRRTDA